MKGRIIEKISLIAILMLSCAENNPVIKDEETVESFNDTDFETSDWTDKTHSKSGDPDFDELFDNNSVKRLDIVVTAERWQSMLDNMTELYGIFGGTAGEQGNRPGGTAPGGTAPGGTAPGGTAPGGTNVDAEEDPVFVPAEVFYKNKQWYRVGIRFKGNSSLKTSWESGILKLSLKLDFDEFEDLYPQIKNQRFYGFKKLSLKNNYNDNSGLREKVASEIFKRAGLAVSNTAFYTLYIDHGDGPEYFGLYTLVEEVDNTVIKTQFSSNDGNLYKPENAGASFAEGTFNESDFEKKTNEDDGNWSDIQSLFTILHSNTRTTDPVSWRSSLENIFDTDVFLRYLAVNTVIQNWDTYGVMTHNYFLYNNPENNKLTWIPWDNNEALQDGKMGGTLTLDFSNMQQESWPLIEYLYADTEYRAVYDTYIQETIAEAFEVISVQEMYTRYAALIKPYMESELSGYTFLNSTSEFQKTISDLNQHVIDRDAVVEAYLK